MRQECECMDQDLLSFCAIGIVERTSIGMNVKLKKP